MYLHSNEESNLFQLERKPAENEEMWTYVFTTSWEKKKLIRGFYLREAEFKVIWELT